MARRSTGGVVVDTRRNSPVFALRFRAYGRRQYITLGSADEGWTRDKADDALRHTLADVERGIWRPPDRKAAEVAPPEQSQDPTFHEFSSQWFRQREPGWRPNTRNDYQWQLTHHLLPFFAGHRLSQITVAEVDRYMAEKLRQAARYAEAVAAWEKQKAEATDERTRERLRRNRPPSAISAVSINKTLTRLAQILDRAVRYGLIEKNPAKDREARVKVSKRSPVYLDRAEHIGALLDAAGQLDARARRENRHIRRRAMLATLVLAGLRIGELLDLRWRDVDLSAGRITVRQSKTDAGLRQVDVLPLLRGVLATVPRRGPDDLVFPTSTGERQGPSNIRRRVLAPAIASANAQLEQQGDVPLPLGITPHKLRHTYASVLVAIGVDVGAVMDQMGHTDAKFTLKVYRHGMRRDQASRDALRELVGLTDRAAAGSGTVVPVQFPAVAGARG